MSDRGFKWLTLTTAFVCFVLTELEIAAANIGGVAVFGICAGGFARMSLAFTKRLTPGGTDG